MTVRTAPDLRLVPAVAAVWLVTLCCLRPGCPWQLIAAVPGLACAVLVPLARRQTGGNVGSALWVVVGAAALACCAAVGTGLRVDLRDAAAIGRWDGHATVISVHVDEWPRQLGGKPGGHLDASRMLVPATAVAVAVEAADHGAPAQVPTRDRVVIVGAVAHLARLVPGETVEVRARVLRSERPGLTTAVLLATAEPRLLHPAPARYRIAAAVRRGFAVVAAASLPPLAAGLLPGLVLGDESATAPTVRGDFVASGLTHLTAVSGANFAVVTMCVLGLCTVIGLPRAARVAVTVGAIGAFVLLVGPTGSVVRAAVMGLFGVAAVALRRTGESTAALAAAVVVLLLARPQLAGDPGFALSVAATTGLLWWAPGVADWLMCRGLPRAVAGVLAICLVAQLVTTPLIVALSGRLPTGAFAANVIAGPVIPLITVVGTAAAVLAVPLPAVAELLARVTGPGVAWLLGVAHFFARWPTVTVPAGPVAGLATAAVGSAVGVVWQHVKRGRGRRYSGARRGGDRGPPGRAGYRSDRGRGARGGGGRRGGIGPRQRGRRRAGDPAAGR
ncbi:ComEC/Rec2 family competence protein [Tsukamurella soli]|uniref:ComEC/Rec2 family competence protein n=1 Tax=Tsukamurella soli TaxID=644556 RepID=A0ABP8KE12_9ACTN